MNIDIAGNLKRLRTARGLTQEELAGFLGVTFQAVSKWERGEGYPDVTMLPALEDFFGVTLDELIGMERIRDQARLALLHARWKENNAVGLNEENIRLMHGALRDLPGDYLAMAELVTSLEKSGVSPGSRRYAALLNR